jgi:4-diphosphocytidyl-2-C-methyl-D-erythritol kinase
VISFPNAKINLGLYITARRPDGFHNIESVFYPIPCKDALEFVPSQKPLFTSTGIPIPGDVHSNLCLRAVDLLRKDFSEIGMLNIHLHKMIPMGGGLGGGSSDAAFLINMLNNYYKLNLSIERRKIYAAQLGSDCSFFIKNEPAFVHGRGEFSEGITLNLSGWWLVLVFPGIHVSTPAAFANVKPRKAEIDLRLLAEHDVESWREKLNNQFEESVFEQFPAIEKIKNELYQLGATYASMTGSGSTVYALFKEAPDAISSPLFAETRVYPL